VLTALGLHPSSTQIDTAGSFLADKVAKLSSHQQATPMSGTHAALFPRSVKLALPDFCQSQRRDWWCYVLYKPGGFIYGILQSTALKPTNTFLIFTYEPCIFIFSKFFCSPTDAQVNCLKNNFKIYIKIDIKTAPTCFGAVTPSSGSPLLVLAKVTVVKLAN
jgi:hypothetical protein